MITASPGVITAGATSALLVVLAARRLHTSGGGYGLLATIIHLYVLDGMRGRVFSGYGYPPDHGLTCPSLPKILRGTCR
jgi:hypothetical protein